MVLENLDRPSQRARQKPIVGRKQEEIVGGNPLDSFVVSVNVPAVGDMAPESDPRVFAGQCLANGRAVVSRSIVDDQHLNVDAALVENAAHTAAQVTSV